MLLIVLLSGSCIQEVEVFDDNDNSTLIIEGIITNHSENVEVTLAYSRKFNVRPDFEKLRGAEVRVVDNLGNEVYLEYAAYGKYVGSDFQGVVGRTYELKVKMPTGETYSSLPETMLPVSPIKELKHERRGNNVQFLVDFEDDENTRDYYRWRYTGTHEVFSPTAYELDQSWQYPQSGGVRCYGWASQPDFSEVYSCWVTKTDLELLNISNDFVFNGLEVKNKEVYSVELDRKFNYGYSGEVEQYSLTKDAYKFWAAIREQIGNGGTIFETANYQIRGNIYSDENPGELVLGYFGASAVTTERIFVTDFIDDYGDVSCEPNQVGCVPESCIDCRAYSASSTNIRPDYWPE